MLNATRIVDRGRLLFGLVIVIPLGVALAGPAGLTSSPAKKADVWTAEHVGTEHSGDDHGESLTPLTPAEVLDAFAAAGGGTGSGKSSGTASASAGLTDQDVAAHAEEAEGELTSELPPTYIPGTPPTSDLAAILRQSEQRNAGTSAPPTSNAAVAALVRNPNMRFTRQSQVTDLTTGQVDPRIVDMLAWVAQRHQITITSMKTDHSMYVAGTGRVSAHKLGRAVDIAIVDGRACDAVPGSPCSRVYEEIVNSLRGTQYQPSQVIYGYDLWPSERWNFAMGNHRDHIHVGY